MAQNVIGAINGPVVKVRRTADFSMMEMVHVGEKRLLGEVIAMNSEETTIQVYENTTGLRVGEPVEPTGGPMCATLAPGILTGIYDGIQRPLDVIAAQSGAFIPTGLDVSALDTQKKWRVTLRVKAGDRLAGGAVFAACPETPLIEHRIMVPPGVSGEVVFAAPDGEYTMDGHLLTLRDGDGREHALTMTQRWPIRTPRPCRARLPIDRPLLTGQRVIDTLIPIAKGGTAAVPGGFGTGKTMTQHQIAKWCDADIIVYIGCGERGNEMTQVLDEFGALIDPKSGQPLSARTVLIANTSNMPVAAREASIYTGLTLAEYYRDMGYHVAIMADSTSRWAEALREISGRLEEMPAEEGFPAYLPSRISQFYERAGYMENLDGSEGSVTIIGAVSPQGADFSEPVTQNTKRFVRCFWALDKSLAYARHYPAINWSTSYSEYVVELAGWYEKNVSPDFLPVRQRMNNILQEEDKLMEIVKLIGADVLPDEQKLVIEAAKVIRVGFLQQNAFHKDDTYVPMEKQLRMMQVILLLYDEALRLVQQSVPIATVLGTGLFDKLIKMKYDIPNDGLSKFDGYEAEIRQTCAELRARGAEGGEAQ
ncbi:V-type ATP synthase subunit A [Intestinibacillus massiliensis]|nr:V-type ATP synthase subunit A [Intestinibacillus massiliensis]